MRKHFSECVFQPNIYNIEKNGVITGKVVLSFDFLKGKRAAKASGKGEAAQVKERNSEPAPKATSGLVSSGLFANWRNSSVPQDMEKKVIQKRPLI